MSEKFSEWTTVEEEDYDALIPKYKKHLKKLQFFRYAILTSLLLSVLFLDLPLFATIVSFGIGLNIFLWMSSQARITYLKITIMDNIRRGTIDQLLE